MTVFRVVDYCAGLDYDVGDMYALLLAALESLLNIDRLRRNVMRSGRMCVVVLLAVFVLGSPVWSAARVSVVGFEDAGAPVRHGLDKVVGALAEKGANVEKVGDLKSANGKVIIVADVGGKTSAGAALLAQLKLKAPSACEALLVRNMSWKGRKAVLLSGADERGLMYALLDTADRIGWAQDKHPKHRSRP